jgi:hypothetical protein
MTSADRRLANQIMASISKANGFNPRNVRHALYGVEDAIDARRRGNAAELVNRKSRVHGA